MLLLLHRRVSDVGKRQAETIILPKEYQATIDVLTISPTRSHVLVSVALSSPLVSSPLVSVSAATASVPADALLDKLLAYLPANTSFTSRGYRGSYASWLDVGRSELWTEDEGYAGVVPCRGVWNSEGQRIAGVFAFWCATSEGG